MVECTVYLTFSLWRWLDITKDLLIRVFAPSWHAQDQTSIQFVFRQKKTICGDTVLILFPVLLEVLFGLVLWPHLLGYRLWRYYLAWIISNKACHHRHKRACTSRNPQTLRWMRTFFHLSAIYWSPVKSPSLNFPQSLRSAQVFSKLSPLSEPQRQPPIRSPGPRTPPSGLLVAAVMAMGDRFQTPRNDKKSRSSLLPHHGATPNICTNLIFCKSKVVQFFTHRSPEVII